MIGPHDRDRRRRVGALALAGVALALGAAAWLGTRSGDHRTRDFEVACQALHKARLGDRAAFAEAKSAFRAARGRFYQDSAPVLGLSVTSALEVGSAQAEADPFVAAIARADDKGAEHYARARGGRLAEDGARLAAGLARAAQASP